VKNETRARESKPRPTAKPKGTTRRRDGKPPFINGFNFLVKKRE